MSTGTSWPRPAGAVQTTCECGVSGSAAQLLATDPLTITRREASAGPKSAPMIVREKPPVAGALAAVTLVIAGGLYANGKGGLAAPPPTTWIGRLAPLPSGSVHWISSLASDVTGHAP